MAPADLSTRPDSICVFSEMNLEVTRHLMTLPADVLVLVAPELGVSVLRAVAADEDVRYERGLEGKARTGDAEKLVRKLAPRARVGHTKGQV